MSEQPEHYTPEEEDLVDQELGIAEQLTQHDELVAAVQSGLTKAWSFETLAIQAELEKVDDSNPDLKWIEGTLKSSYYDVEQEPEEILAELNMSAEAFHTRAGEILGAVLSFLKRILVGALKIIRNLINFLTGIEARAKRIRYFAENAKHRKPGPNSVIEMGRSAQRLLVGRSVVTDARQLKDALETHRNYLALVRQYIGSVQTQGAALVKAIESYDFNDPDKDLRVIRDAYSPILETSLFKSCNESVKDNRFFAGKDYSVLTSKPLLGGKQFYRIVSRITPVAEIHSLRAVLRSRLSFQYATADLTATGGKFKSMTADEIISVMTDVLELSASSRSLVNDDIERKIESMNEALSKASKRFLTYFERSDIQSSQAAVEIAVDAVKAFSEQTTTPLLNYVSTLNSSLRAVTTLGKASLANLR